MANKKERLIKTYLDTMRFIGILGMILTACSPKESIEVDIACTDKDKSMLAGTGEIKQLECDAREARGENLSDEDFWLLLLTAGYPRASWGNVPIGSIEQSEVDGVALSYQGKSCWNVDMSTEEGALIVTAQCASGGW